YLDLAVPQDGSKLVICTGSNPEADDAVWVVDVASSRIESRHPAGRSRKGWAHIGAARLSPDNRRLYWVHSDYLNDFLNGHPSIQCIDPHTGQRLWNKESPDGVSSLDISPDGRLLASASAFRDTKIHIWDTGTGKLLGPPLDRHTAWVCDLAFTRDGRRLISAAADQTIRFWDTSTWTETQELRGHADEAGAIPIAEPSQRIASAGKDGSLK